MWSGCFRASLLLYRDLREVGAGFWAIPLKQTLIAGLVFVDLFHHRVSFVFVSVQRDATLVVVVERLVGLGLDIPAVLDSHGRKIFRRFSY